MQVIYEIVKIDEGDYIWYRQRHLKDTKKGKNGQ